ncbi:MAG: FtsX-like permease family protein [Sphingopyxis sp.]
MNDYGHGNGNGGDPPPPILPSAGMRGPLPWMVAVMTMLAMLGLAAAIGLTPAADALSGQIAGRATIQLVDVDPLVRRDHVRRVRDVLRDAPYVAAMRTVPETELRAMASQWLGDGVVETGMPLPALIDVDLVESGRSSGTDSGMSRLRAAVAEAAPSARVIAHADWLGPVAGLMTSVGWIAASAALLLMVIAAAVAVLSARAALSSQRATIDILHLVGATDVQVARLFQRQIARDTMVGAGIGGIAGLLLVALIGWQLQLVAATLASGSHRASYAFILLLPPLIVAIAVFFARLSALRALRAMP